MSKNSTSRPDAGGGGGGSALQSGIYLINKPGKMTSHDVVAQVRRVLGTREVGHAGTLDPMATGLMVVLVGEATKISDYVLNGNKGYHLKVKLGLETDTLDTDGEILSQQDVNFDPIQIRKAANEQTGDFEWPVPIYSAIKKDGKKLYEYARADKAVQIPIKTMTFWDVAPIEVTASTFSGTIRCSKGSYIRTWAAQLGKSLGVGGTLSYLQRVYSDPYEVKDAMTLEEFEQGNRESFIPLSKTLPQMQIMTVKGKDERLMMNGQVSFDLEKRLVAYQKDCNRLQQPHFFKMFNPHGELLAILEMQPFRSARVKRVFNLP